MPILKFQSLKGQSDWLDNMTVAEIARSVPQGVIQAPPDANVGGYLIVVIEEATGNNKNDEYTWD